METLIRALQDLFASQKLCVVSTHREGRPYASLVAYWAEETHPRQIVFFTPKATRKFANLTADPRVAVLLHNSANQESDFHKAMAVTGIGTAVEIDKRQHRQRMQQFLLKHPYLEEFARSPSCAMICITVDRYILVQNFQNVTELQFDEPMDSPG